MDQETEGCIRNLLTNIRLEGNERSDIEGGYYRVRSYYPHVHYRGTFKFPRPPAEMENIK